ncbi:hydantoinase/oxoprolinase family protein [Desulfogranum japonicum]|uniref:hydantoinase/oxoprolinase family protein n=1 Tax=Desulfogranum japonicum TaxID=231447 RepID=UPI00040E02F4|nr:hydantoinase/oxoprolinase family protein [Desulfogranum japonicum]
MDTYCIGIDTGGTFTDAVAVRLADNSVAAQSKTRTTHNDLAVGVGTALKELFQSDIQPSQIAHLAVSTTLATNAVVEGHGARVGLFVLGYVRHFKLPVVANIFIKGGHTITGEEDEPLDMETLVDTLQELRKEVDSYAICGAMSIKNPTHELVAEKAISLIDPKPVFCSHLVSSHPGMQERAATACLHAKLMPLMVDFLSSIQRSMLSLGLECPVSIICGDGTDANLEETVERAAITMASGPAATARFGSFSTQESALIVDVGGTTTDICLLKNGLPVLSDEGCRIGPWQTHVEAVDMYTAAGGGDSQVLCMRDGELVLGKNRIQPLAITEDLPDPALWLQPKGDHYMVLPEAGRNNLTEDNNILIQALATHGSMPPSRLTEVTGIQGISLEKQVERLAFEQRLVLSGFTPTDALHVLGELQVGNSEISKKAATIYGRHLGISAETFCQQVVAKTVETIAESILTYLARSVWSPEHAAVMLHQQTNAYFSLNFSVHLPLIGIGAAAPFFLPQVAERLNTTVRFPEHYAVGNAVGAAIIGMQNVQERRQT